ncbi:amidohydrolase family protein [Gordonia sp. (in: high G+C Gram-positive bacteria)]|uniref:amidohydrolase family protein n=1 Tax=Gordonia sp. (in: high G+C Gram-positive bacteria) TaxID=84139 RepID=UPI003C75F42A
MVTLEGILPGIVDAHVHYFHPTRSAWALQRFARLAQGPARFAPAPVLRLAAKVGAVEDRRYRIDPSIMAKPYEPAQYTADTATLARVAGVGITNIVAVESHWRPAKSPAELMESSLTEVAYLESLPDGAAAPSNGAIVAAADPRVEGFGAHLDRLVATAEHLRGIRFKWAHHPDPAIFDWRHQSDTVASRDFLRGFEQIARHNLAFVSFSYSHQLGYLDALAREFPETTIAIEHLGVPVGVFGPAGVETGMTASARAEILNLWRERMAMIALRPNVVVKVSGVGLSVLGYGMGTAGSIGSRAVLADMIGPLLVHVVEHFGPDRVIFGSDSPVDRPNSSIDMTVGAILDVLGGRGDYLLRQLFAGNAQRVYRLG